MANKLIDYPSYTDLPPQQPVAPEPYISLPEAFSAQWGYAFSPIVEQNKFYSAPSYDEGATEKAEEFIGNPNLNLSEQEKTYIRNFSTSFQTLDANVRHIEVQRARQRTISKLSGPTAMISSPSFGIDLMLLLAPIGLPAALSKMTFGATRAGLQSTVSRVATGRGIGWRESAKIGAAYGAAEPIISGAISVGTALSEQDEKAAIREARNAVYMATLFSAFGAGISGGITKAIGRPMHSEIPLDGGNMMNATEIAEAKLKNRVDEIKQKKPPSSKQERARTAKNKKLAENYLKYVDDVSGDEVGAEIGFKNETLLKFVAGPVSTPFRRIILGNIESLKGATMKLAADLGSVTKANEVGLPTEMSVHLKKALRSKDWGNALTKIDEAYMEVNPRRNQAVLGARSLSATEKVRKFIGKESFTLDDWYQEVGKHVLRNTPIDQIDSEPLKRSVVAYREFMVPYTKELEELGLINSKDLFVEKMLKAAGKKGELISVSNKIIKANKKWMAKETDFLLKRGNKLTEKESAKLTYLQDLTAKLDGAKTFDDLIALRPVLDLTPRMSSALDNLNQAIGDLADQIDSYKGYIDNFETRDQVHFPRVYDRVSIRKNREAFEAILRRWFTENPEFTAFNEQTLKFEQVTASTDPAEVAKRAKAATDNILQETDEDDIEMMFTGLGKGGPLAARRLDIPTELLEDFVVKDIRDIMIAYSDRVGGRIEFHKAFKDPVTGKAQALEDILEQLRFAAKKEGASDLQIEEGIKDFVSLYDSVVGTVIKNPDALDNKIAEALRSVTNMTFLGRAGIAAIGDASSLFMDHDLDVIGKVLLSPFNKDAPFAATTKELRAMGDLLEIERGMAHVRFMEGFSTSPFVKSTWDKMNNAFYNLNGLNFVTMKTKTLEGMARGHTLIERSRKLVNGTATKYETEFLARNGIDAAKAKRIIAQPVEETENGLILPNSSQWEDLEIKELFQTSMRAGIANRIIMATPADRPHMMNGVLYFREETAKQWGLPIIKDSRVPGYVRYESGMMTIPFAFYSYTLGALTKITGNYAQGAVNNKAAHVAASMILGGMIVKARTPEWAWNEMDTTDKVARALDFSGLAALHTDMVYRILAMASESGVNVEGFPIQPKFQADVDPLGAAVSVFGAPADYSYNLVKSIKELTTGEFTDGAKGLINSLPFISALAFQGTIKDTLKAAIPNQ